MGSEVISGQELVSIKKYWIFKEKDYLAKDLRLNFDRPNGLNNFEYTNDKDTTINLLSKVFFFWYE